jgi:sodium/bile acid cotransporter 7
LLLPFAVGHFLRPQIGAFVAKHKQLTTVVVRGSILLVVYGAFSGAVVAHIWTKVSPADLIILLAACALILALVLSLTWQFGKLMKFSKPDRVVLLFCGSKKSLASGVPMAGVLFAPATVGIVILPLMVFHQLQLIACAFIARRLGAQADSEEKAAAAH